MLSIGDFARYAGVSVRMLRHYDEIGLLRPDRVDPVTGYRTYTAAQFARVNRLVALKDLGFSLEQVGRILEGGLDAAELRRLLAERREELAERIESDRRRLASVAERLRSIEKEGLMSQLEFVVKSVPAVRLAQRSTRVTTMAEIGPAVGPLFAEVGAALEAASATPTGAAQAWYAADEDGVALGVGWPVALPELAGAEVLDLPAHARAVTVVHRGSMRAVGETWQALAAEVERLGLQPDARAREVYHHVEEGDEDAWVTELQQPVR